MAVKETAAQIREKFEMALQKMAGEFGVWSLIYSKDIRSEKAGKFLSQAAGLLRRAARFSRRSSEQDDEGSLWLGTLSDLAEQINKTVPGPASWSPFSSLFDQVAFTLSKEDNAPELQKHLKGASNCLYQVHRIFAKQKRLKIW